MVNISFPYNEMDADAMQDSLLVLRGIAERGNRYIRACHSHLIKIKDTINLKRQSPSQSSGLSTGREDIPENTPTTGVTTGSQVDIPDTTGHGSGDNNGGGDRVEGAQLAPPPPRSNHADEDESQNGQFHLSASASDATLGGPMQPVTSAENETYFALPTPSPAVGTMEMNVNTGGGTDLWDSLLDSIDIDMDRQWMESTLQPLLGRENPQ